MSGVNGRCRELHSPPANKQPAKTEAMATSAVAPINKPDTVLLDSFSSEDETETASNMIMGKYAGNV